MKAVFVNQDAVLRDSHIDPADPSQDWHLVPATVEAMRLLANEDTLVFLYGAQIGPSDQASAEEPSRTMLELVHQTEAGGGRIDGLVVCPHAKGTECRCWEDFPGILWVPASQFNLKLEACYVLGDTERDVATAHTAGARAMTILCDRKIGDVFGDLPRHKDYPIAPDLTTAVNYIALEEEICNQLGHVQTSEVRVPVESALYAEPEGLPRLTVTSRLARGLQANVNRSRVQLRDIVRWLSFFSVGAVGLSLGIAYLLTHLYRVQPFPAAVYYVTLQFVPRPVRGALFILFGAGIIFLAVRSFYRSTARWRRPNPG
ncbi:MAG: hypothetical protein JXA74_11825 [Anaerolineae bacterium]|nr:hypothetical protein [Anaerolineae bacterium]